MIISKSLVLQSTSRTANKKEEKQSNKNKRKSSSSVGRSIHLNYQKQQQKSIKFKKCILHSQHWAQHTSPRVGWNGMQKFNEFNENRISIERSRSSLWKKVCSIINVFLYNGCVFTKATILPLIIRCINTQLVGRRQGKKSSQQTLQCKCNWSAAKREDKMQVDAKKCPK